METNNPRPRRVTAFSRAGSLMASLGLVALMLGSATVALADPTDNYATVTSHQAFSSGANNAGYWCAGGTDTEVGANVSSFVLTADYAEVIVKAGADQYANTIFDNPSSGQTVWADTNGNSVFDPGGQDGDKNISHIIFCPTAAVVAPTEVTVTWQLPAGLWVGNGSYDDWTSGQHLSSYPGPSPQSQTFPQTLIGQGDLTPPCDQWAQVDFYRIDGDSDQALLTSLLARGTLAWTNGPADAAIYSSGEGYGFKFVYGGDCQQPTAPTVTPSCSGSVTFSGIPEGWSVILDDQTMSPDGTSATYPVGVGQHTYSYLDANEGAVSGGTFNIEACPLTIVQPQYGSLVVTKALAGTLTGFTGGAFTFSVSCTSPSSSVPLSYGQVTVNVATDTTSASSAAINSIPLGAVCTVTETSRADAGKNASWVETVLPSGTATIQTTASPASVTITNTRKVTPPKTPTGGVAGATSRPHITPPPTATLGSTTSGQPASSTWLLLLALAGLLGSILLLTPVPARARRKR